MCQVERQIGRRRSQSLADGLTTTLSTILQQGMRILLVDIYRIGHGTEVIGQRRLVVLVELTYKPDALFGHLAHGHVLGGKDNRCRPVGKGCAAELVVVGHRQECIVILQCKGGSVDAERPVVISTVAALTKGLGIAILIDYLPLHGVVCRVVHQIVRALLGCYVWCRQLHALGAPLHVCLRCPAGRRILEPIDGLSVPVGLADDFVIAIDNGSIVREHSHHTILVERSSIERQRHLLGCFPSQGAIYDITIASQADIVAVDRAQDRV